MSAWPPEREAELTALFGEGLTCASIAAIMGTTKNAIVGRLHRLELYRGRRYSIEPKAKRAPPLAPLGEPAELLRLNPEGCRWGVGEIVKHRHIFCGQPRLNGFSYCEKHWRRSLGRRSLGP